MILQQIWKRKRKYPTTCGDGLSSAITKEAENYGADQHDGLQSARSTCTATIASSSSSSSCCSSSSSTIKKERQRNYFVSCSKSPPFSSLISFLEQLKTHTAATTTSSTSAIPKNSLVLWASLMSTLQIGYILRENTYNEVIACILLSLSLVGLAMKRIIELHYNHIDKNNNKNSLVVFIVIVIFQTLLLFGVNSIIACAHKAQSPINSVAWKFLWVSKDIKQKQGLVLDIKAVIEFLTPIFLQAVFHSMCLFIGIMSLVVVAAVIIMETNSHNNNNNNNQFLAVSAVILDNFIKPVTTFLIKMFHIFLQCIWMVSCLFLFLQNILVITNNHRNANGFITQNLHNDTTQYCSSPPPIQFETTPNVIVLTIDSWRRDTVSKRSMPKLFEFLERSSSPTTDSNSNSQSQSQHSYVEWKNHDSCAVQSDQGYASLFYSMLGMKREKVLVHKNSPSIRSWTLQAFEKFGGYEMHKVTKELYDFCWLLMEKCDLHIRDYQYHHSGSLDYTYGHSGDEDNEKDDYQYGYDNYHNGYDLMNADHYNNQDNHDVHNEKNYYYRQSVVLNILETLLKQQHNKTIVHDKVHYADKLLPQPPPMLISADMQDLHHPLNCGNRTHLQDLYKEPFMTDSEIWRTYSGGIEITPENKEEYVQKLRNRVTNCLLNLDDDLGMWLQKIQPYINNTVLILTGDHTDLLFDSESNFIWHGVNNPIDIQRQVPLFMYGPAEIISTLQVADDGDRDNGRVLDNNEEKQKYPITTAHTDVFPSLLEAVTGKPLGPRWQEELEYRSYYNPDKKQNNDDNEDISIGFLRRSKNEPSSPSSSALSPVSSNGLAYNSLHGFQVLIDGNARVSVLNGIVQEAYHLDQASKDDKIKTALQANEIERMTKVIQRIESRTWPGWNSDDCSTTGEAPTGISTAPTATATDKEEIQ